LLAPRYRPRVPVTRVLIGIMVVTFVADVLGGGDPMWGAGPLTDAGALYPPAVWAGQWWRLVTWIFLHGGALHLFVNAFSLYNLGLIVEPGLGPGRYVLLFFGSGLVSALASQAFVTEAPSVGASGAVFGVAGLLLADEFARRRQYRELERAGGPRLRPAVSIIPALILNLALGVAIPVINNYAHVGGLAAGYLLGEAWIGRYLHRTGRARLAYLALGLMVGALAVAGFRPAFNGEAAYRRGVEAAQAGEWDVAYRTLSTAAEQSGGRRADVLAERAYVLVKSDRLDEALADVNRALELEPRNPRYRFLRASIYFRLGAPTAARIDAEAACDGGHAEACRAVGRK
jgi:rhomboid protease GluP